MVQREAFVQVDHCSGPLSSARDDGCQPRTIDSGLTRQKEQKDDHLVVNVSVEPAKMINLKPSHSPRNAAAASFVHAYLTKYVRFMRNLG